MRTLRVDRRRARVDSLVSMSFLLLRIGSPFVERLGGQGLPLLRERLLVTRRMRHIYFYMYFMVPVLFSGVFSVAPVALRIVPGMISMDQV